MELNKEWKSITMKELEVLVWVCTTLIKVLNVLLTAALTLLYKENILSI